MTTYKLKITNKFKKQLKKLQQNKNFNLENLDYVLNILKNNQTLPANFRNHLLQPKKKGIWECHVQPDILLEYQKVDDLLILILLNIDSHSNLFK